MANAAPKKSPPSGYAARNMRSRSVSEATVVLSEATVAARLRCRGALSKRMVWRALVSGVLVGTEPRAARLERPHGNV